METNAVKDSSLHHTNGDIQDVSSTVEIYRILEEINLTTAEKYSGDYQEDNDEFTDAKAEEENHTRNPHNDFQYVCVKQDHTHEEIVQTGETP